MLVDALGLLEARGVVLPPFPCIGFSIGDVTCNDPRVQLAYAVANNRTCSPVRTVPDFTFEGWPEAGVANFTTEAELVARAGAHPPQLPATCGWAGNPATHPSRSKFVGLAKKHPKLLQAHVPPPKWKRSPGRNGLMANADMVEKWACLVDLPGRGYSGRIPLLLHTGRPLLIVDRPDVVWFTHATARFRRSNGASSSDVSQTGAWQPWVHFIPVKADLSDLVEKVLWVDSHPKEAGAIGTAAQRFAQRHLNRPAAVEFLATELLEAATAARGAL